MRGKLRHSLLSLNFHRITPACAGKTKRMEKGDWSLEDHPRVCGENKSAKSTKLPISGSPPRVRGKHRTGMGERFEYRITPACAGKTRNSKIQHLHTEDHPRVCGENQCPSKGLQRHAGSPPRVRGKRGFTECFEAKRRITPACAGKTFSTGLRRSAKEDHPRVCGENNRGTAVFTPEVGSPPRVRGKQNASQRREVGERITPACAGKTSSHPIRYAGEQDHPRVCGENSERPRRETLLAGSPPRVRGKLSISRPHITLTRITPACAGKTRRSACGGILREDHPRVCGENKTPVSVARSAKGSPPRVRGKRRPTP